VNDFQGALQAFPNETSVARSRVLRSWLAEGGLARAEANGVALLCLGRRTSAELVHDDGRRSWLKKP
jgi:hypothetical protein